MDDVDAVQAQIARNMLESGDWVTPRLDGIAYLEKAPLKYWTIAASFAIFGVHDWAARIPVVVSVVLLCCLVAHIGAWAHSPRAGLCAGLALATSTGLFLFTRVLIPDAMLTLAVTVSIWAFLRLLESHARRWPLLFWAGMGVGFLLKGLIALLFPVAAVALYLLFAKRAGDRAVWSRLRIPMGLAVTTAIAAPWVVLATLRNPPYLDLTMRSAPGEHHGFFWFFFLNEHLFRFLNMRHPRDYNTVPRLAFWLFHLLWLFPWSVYLPAAFRRGEGSGRWRRVRLLALCWAGFVLVFFTFSTTQEYYSMPCYPALALLIGAAVAGGGSWIRPATRALGVLSALAAVVSAALYYLSLGRPTPGDISQALTLNPEAYTLSLGHMRDLTLGAFAYLGVPLLAAAAAFLLGAAGALLLSGVRATLAIAAMMVLFTHAARIAMVAFDPYLSSRPLAEAMRKAPPGEVIFDNQYYTFSSVFFYADLKRAWLLNGRVNNLEYGSYAPGAPDIFLTDEQLVDRWRGGARHYLLIEGPSVERVASRVGRQSLKQVAASGGKFLFTNLVP